MALKLYILIIVLGIISFIFTYLIIKFALKKQIVSIPNERSLHEVPTPVGGGLAIVTTWYLGLSVLFFYGALDRNLYYALLSGVFLTIVSLTDDLVSLKPYIRLIVHFITATIAFVFLGGLRPIIVPGINLNFWFIVYPVAIVGMVWFINLFNFMDGVDGLASNEAITICLVMFFLSGGIINILLIACISGFLYWNWPKARIFMGDVGSTQLGFILVVLGIYFHNEYKFSILNWIMISSPFWFDATLTLIRRLRKGDNLGVAHKKHAYQRIVQAGFSHLKVNLYFVMMNLFVLLIILIYREFKVLQVPLFILTLLLYYLITRQIDKRVPFN